MNLTDNRQIYSRGIFADLPAMTRRPFPLMQYRMVRAYCSPEVRKQTRLWVFSFVFACFRFWRRVLPPPALFFCCCPCALSYPFCFLFWVRPVPLLGSVSSLGFACGCFDFNFFVHSPVVLFVGFFYSWELVSWLGGPSARVEMTGPSSHVCPVSRK